VRPNHQIRARKGQHQEQHQLRLPIQISLRHSSIVNRGGGGD
jgi:hypothetical protein